MSSEKKRKVLRDKEIPSRTLVLSGEVEEESVAELIQDISDINDFDDDQESNIVDYERTPIKLVVNSMGGSVYDGFALIGVIEKSLTFLPDQTVSHEFH